ncbi:MAG: class A beta-lactamase-related serine hydrolase [Scytonematopsis contorta HA4267-MV1]|nr:class A beta-lactamase-related serine hydrolase [Scytonematopsis contorta HA4267-MV1]
MLSMLQKQVVNIVKTSLFVSCGLSLLMLGGCSPATSKNVQQPSSSQPVASPGSIEDNTKFAGVVTMGKAITALDPQLQPLIQKYNTLQTGMFFLDLDNGDYLDVGGDKVFSAASTIKLPILMAFFQDVDAGKIKLDEKLATRKDLLADQAGFLQYQPLGKQYTALDTATLMIVFSDNTATNMIIDRLGGIAVLNERFKSWGMKDTVLNSLLSDMKGTNLTTSKDLARSLVLLVNDKLMSQQSKEMTLDILRRTRTKTLLPAGLGKGAKIYHKTGDIGFVIGDAGVITMPNGKRYLGSIFVTRKYNDIKGREFIQQISKLVYKYQSEPHTVAVENKR